MNVQPRFELAASPHVHTPDSTERIMWTVVATLLPIVTASFWFFGVGALLVVTAAVAGTLLTERLTGPRSTLRDGSALITGLLLGLILPPGFPLWMAFAGGVVAIGFGKVIFGGLGQNVFNPALVGRAFLQAAFPAAITTWPALGGSRLELPGDNFALPLMSPQVDAITEATPLGLMKFEHTATDLGSLLLGNTGGSIGETSALLILLCGAYLAWKRYLDWRIPVSIFATVAALSGLLWVINPERYADPLFMLFSGGLVFGAVYMATDMVTSPVTRMGAWIFGAGIGALVVLIRTWGGLPEGVMYAILLMNAMVPFINRATRPRVFGTARRRTA
ncbi:MAG TPA: RnfABCDGE type electron transport complex subunit D [Longimicrobiales bacterium]|nr:RnfABCDGE type electron transport complex subunit D [Longimicrobiales bacterium]